MASNTAVENIILGCLSTKPMSGYEIKSLISMSTSLFYNASYGSIYPTLKKHEENGLVVSREQVDNGRFKKIYELTEVGEKVLMEWLQQDARPITIKNDMLLRLFFYGNLPNEKRLELTSDYIKQLKSFKQELDEIDPIAQEVSDIYQQYTLRWGKDFYSFLIDWYENLLKELKKIQ